MKLLRETIFTFSSGETVVVETIEIPKSKSFKTHIVGGPRDGLGHFYRDACSALRGHTQLKAAIQKGVLWKPKKS